MASGFDEIMEARKWLSNHFSWYATHWDWNSGYLVLVQVPRKTEDFNVDLDDGDTGLLAFTRNSYSETWDGNVWDMQVCNKESWYNPSFDANELEHMAKLMKALNDCKEPYKKHSELTEEMLQKRTHMERVLKSYGYED